MEKLMEGTRKTILGPTEDFYRGFVTTGGEDGKVPTHPFKIGAEKAYMDPFEVAAKSESFAGVLEKHVGYIDIDQPDSAIRLLNAIRSEGLNTVVRGTSRGIHSNYLNTKGEKEDANIVTKSDTGVLLSCGIIADVKVGVNSTQMLRVKGVDRKIIYPVEGDGSPKMIDELSVWPVWLRPIGTPSSSFPNLVGMKEGDGRYIGLRKLAERCALAGLNAEEIKKCVAICNAFVFAEPLSDEEIETKGLFKYIDKLLPKTRPFVDEKGRFHPNILADKLKIGMRAVNMDNVVQVPDVYGIYHPDLDGLLQAAVENYPDITIGNMNLISRLIYLWTKNYKKAERAHYRYIAFQNGVLDIQTMDFDPDGVYKLVMVNMIPWRYNPKAPAVPLVDQFLNDIACGDAGIIEALLETLGACLYDCPTIGQATFLLGPGGNGKSSFQRVGTIMLGEENVMSRTLSSLSGEFVKQELYGKKALIGDEIGDDYISGADSANFKSLIGGGRITANVKFEKPITFDPFATFIFACNTMPRFSDKSYGTLRRVKIIPFDHNFSEDPAKLNIDIAEALNNPECMEYLIRLSVDALRRYIANGCKIGGESPRMDAVMAEWLGEQQPLNTFWTEVTPDFFDGVPVYVALSHVNEWLKSRKYMEVSVTYLSRFLKSKGYVTSIVNRRRTYTFNGITQYYPGKTTTIYELESSTMKRKTAVESLQVVENTEADDEEGTYIYPTEQPEFDNLMVAEDDGVDCPF